MQHINTEISGESSGLTQVKDSENKMVKSEQKYLMGFLHLKAEDSLMFMKPDIPFGALIYPVCWAETISLE